MNNKLTNFESVGVFHDVFGHPKPSTIMTNILSENPKLAQFRLSLINEEYNELVDAVNTNNFVEVIDALSDILYVVYGMGQAFGINLDKAFDIVHKSNMSKLCKTQQEAEDTINYYKTLPEFANVNVKYRLAKDGVHYVVYNFDTGKILKSMYFTQPDFTELLGNN